MDDQTLAAVLVAFNIENRNKQTKQFGKAIGELKDQMEYQRLVLESINNKQFNQLEEIKRQTKLMEASERRLLVEKAAQQSVFELKIQLEKINELSSNLEKFFLASSLLDFISKSDIPYENLPTISDKEQFYDLRKKLTTISKDTRGKLNKIEKSDFTLIGKIVSDYLKNEKSVTLIKKLISDIDNYDDEIAKINEKNSLVDPKKAYKEFEKTEEGKKQSSGNTGGCLLVGGLISICLFVAVALMNDGADIDEDSQTAIMIFGFLIALIIFVRSSMKKESNFKNKIEAQNKSIKQVVERAQTEAKEKNNAKQRSLSKALKDISEMLGDKITVKNFDNKVVQTNAKLQNKIEGISSKYPNVDLNLEQISKNSDNLI